MSLLDHLNKVQTGTEIKLNPVYTPKPAFDLSGEGGEVRGGGEFNPLLVEDDPHTGD